MRADDLGDSFLRGESQSQGPRRESWRPTSLGRRGQEAQLRGAAGTPAFSLGGRGVLRGVT